MALYRKVNGKSVKLSDEEEAALRAEWAETDRLAAIDKAANEYIINRKKAYKSAEEYLDMIWHLIDQDKAVDKTSEFYVDRKAVKDMYPKPVEGSK